MKYIFLALVVCSLAAAQTPARADAKGCVENPVVTRMAGCVITSCEHKEFAAADMPRTQAERNHMIEGELDHTIYRCPKDKSPLELGRNTEAALKNAGFNVFYTYVYGAGARFYLTAQKGGQWVHLSVLDYYDLTTVKQKQMEQVMTANAEGWAQQVNQNGRVSVYGINFDTGKAIIRPDSAPVLSEVAKMLQANASWAMLVAGHTDNVGAREMNLSLSRQRAESVIAWLASRGIDKARLVPAGFGDTRPIADNSSDEGRQKNRRVDLVKVY
jgi:OmpA-OmpF porin, OOP family